MLLVKAEFGTNKQIQMCIYFLLRSTKESNFHYHADVQWICLKYYLNFMF